MATVSQDWPGTIPLNSFSSYIRAKVRRGGLLLQSFLCVAPQHGQWAWFRVCHRSSCGSICWGLQPVTHVQHSMWQCRNLDNSFTAGLGFWAHYEQLIFRERTRGAAHARGVTTRRSVCSMETKFNWNLYKVKRKCTPGMPTTVTIHLSFSPKILRATRVPTCRRPDEPINESIKPAWM